jgi:sugar phosphate isomerase/epimerase
LDPSHLFWQRIDPIAVTARLGAHIGWVHAKDTVVNAEVAALQGMLDRGPAPPGELPWTYATVGHGHEPRWWRRWLAELRVQGYNGVVSLEHEDPFTAPEAGVREGARTLASALRALEVPA